MGQQIAKTSFNLKREDKILIIHNIVGKSHAKLELQDA
jgi:hypothetical protein